MSAETTDTDGEEPEGEDNEEDSGGAWIDVDHDESRMLGDDKTKEEIRVRIGKIMGLKCWEGQELGKSDLNSIYAALTGSFIQQPRTVYRNGSERKAHYYAKVAQACGFVYLATGGEYRPFRKPELQRLLYEVENTDDQREWVKEDPES